MLVPPLARPIEEGFDFVADARNRPRWDDSVEKPPYRQQIESTSGPARSRAGPATRGFGRLKELLETQDG
jgi:hypothetical protein